MLKFLVPEVIKIKELKNGLKVAELFHGPTLAFKDLALGVVGGLYNYFLERSKKKCIVIVGKHIFLFERFISLFSHWHCVSSFWNYLFKMAGKFLQSHMFKDLLITFILIVG